MTPARQTPAFVLVHSPLVGPFTWEGVGEELRRSGIEAVGAVLGRGVPPVWRHHAEEIAVAVRSVRGDPVLVAHSGAGVLLPEARRRANRAVAAYVFVDALIPERGLSLLDLFRRREPAFAAEVERALASGARVPAWTDADLAEEVPDADARSRLLQELQPRDRDFYDERVDVFEGWPDAPCAYLRFTPHYEPYAAMAREAGWVVRERPGRHFEMIGNPSGVATMLLELWEALAPD